MRSRSGWQALAAPASAPARSWRKFLRQSWSRASVARSRRSGWRRAPPSALAARFSGQSRRQGRAQGFLLPPRLLLLPLGAKSPVKWAPAQGEPSARAPLERARAGAHLALPASGAALAAARRPLSRLLQRASLRSGAALLPAAGALSSARGRQGPLGAQQPRRAAWGEGRPAERAAPARPAAGRSCAWRPPRRQRALLHSK